MQNLRLGGCCSIAQLCITFCSPMDCSLPGLSVPHHLSKFPQVHVRCIGDAMRLGSRVLNVSFPLAF